MSIALIDGDHISYVLGWTYRDEAVNTEELLEAVDIFMDTHLTLSGCDQYHGVLASENGNFRKETYRYTSYKGNRGAKPEWYERRHPIIEYRLRDKWGFDSSVEPIEADDCIAAYAEYYRDHEAGYLIMSPDKDLDQIAGPHYRFRENAVEYYTVGPEQAVYNFWCQMITGDSSDNVKGIPGLGIKKAEAILDTVPPMQYRSAVHNQYYKYFGDFYGDIIFQETYATLMLLCSKHPFWNRFRDNWKPLTEAKVYGELNQAQ